MVQPCATFVSMPGSQSKDGDKPSAVTKFKANLAWTKQKTWDPLEAKLNNLSPLNDRAMRGLSQVLLCNSPVTGALVLSGLTLTAPLTAGLAYLGCATANFVAKEAKLDEEALDSGLLGYNGVLLGAAFSVFLPMKLPAVAAATVLGAAITPFVYTAIGNSMQFERTRKNTTNYMTTVKIPQWTLAFNAVALTAFASTRPLEGAVAEAALQMSHVITSPLRGISEIFLVDSAFAGLVLLGAVGYYSRGLAGHMLLGSTVGTLTAATLMGVPAAEIATGMYGFNPALTSLAAGAFFVHSRQTMALSAGSAAATSALYCGMSTTLGAAAAVPALTLPFCVMAAGCHLMRESVPGLVLAATPHSPEKNTK